MDTNMTYETFLHIFWLYVSYGRELTELFVSRKQLNSFEKEYFHWVSFPHIAFCKYGYDLQLVLGITDRDAD